MFIVSVSKVISFDCALPKSIEMYIDNAQNTQETQDIDMRVQKCRFMQAYGKTFFY